MRLIDADALIRLTSARGFRGNKFAEVIKAYVDEMPTIEERKTGKWEEKTICDDVGIGEWQSARCPVCKKYHTTPYMYFFHDYDYCPNCGARMVNDEAKIIGRDDNVLQSRNRQNGH